MSVKQLANSAETLPSDSPALRLLVQEAAAA
jgi:hypothetical protein